MFVSNQACIVLIYLFSLFWEELGFAAISSIFNALVYNTDFSVHQQDLVSPDPFTMLISYSCVPHIRSAITNTWEPRNPEPLIRLIEAWEHIWPSTVLNHVLLGLVFPKLRALVEVWEPRNEVIAVHVWLHPWLPYLGDHMRDVYPTIIFRMSTALQVYLSNVLCNFLSSLIRAIWLLRAFKGLFRV